MSLFNTVHHIKVFIETEAISATELGFTHNFILNTPNVDHVLWDDSVIYVHLV